MQVVELAAAYHPPVAAPRTRSPREVVAISRAVDDAVAKMRAWRFAELEAQFLAGRYAEAPAGAGKAAAAPLWAAAIDAASTAGRRAEAAVRELGRWF